VPGTVFDSILRREIPAHYVWEEDIAVAFLDNRPRTVGHTLVIPRRPVAQWTDLDDVEASRIFWIAQRIGTAQLAAFDCTRAGLVIAGYHVEHVHVHVFPTTGTQDFDFRDLPRESSPVDLDQSARRLRNGLVGLGLGEYVPGHN
jgi:diadenosine tetraphosphate (Ap4A) HIT family hydrolase